MLVHHLAYAGNDEQSNKMTPSELQSHLMSFADRFIGAVNNSTINYILTNPKITPLQRALIEGRKLEASSAAVRIAAGANPEVALLDMVILVELMKYTTKARILPKMNGTDKNLLLEAYQKLEKDIWSIANIVLSKKQEIELHELIQQWKKDKNKPLGVSYFRFSNFAKLRRNSTLVEDGDSGWFLANVSKATKEIERTRVLAERAIFIAERQGTLLRWQVEQVFFELMLVPEFH
ncbi:MAG: hypothetical protein ACC707_18780, partial [Thiohalomonadales bacterium]